MTLDILIPFWGDPDLLRAAVRSVIDQTDPDWRVVVVDDCYPDDTVGPWVNSLDDPRVSYQRNETNLGITDNYRRCLDLARAEWLVFLGCDDLLHPGYVAAVRAAIVRHPEVDVVQPGVTVVDEEGTDVRPLADVVKRRFFRPRVSGDAVLGGEALAVSLLRANWTYWPSLALRTSAVREQEFLDGFPLVQDLALLLDLTRSGSRLLVLDEEVFSYRRHAASASSLTLTDGRRFAGERRYFQIAEEQCRALGWRRAARAARGHIGSRFHAATVLPAALRTRDWASVRAIGRHALLPLRSTEETAR